MPSVRKMPIEWDINDSIWLEIIFFFAVHSKPSSEIFFM